ncbi:MAG: hypothetical protein KA756_12855 [Steroidobacteraceae bacterium]|nr:hypothetical protein [Steroidobacteraceae bacterium]
MRYAEMKSNGFMIGSGVAEAACKTLVTQRLKQSGMRWGVDGARAILTPRAWDQSERFDEAMKRGRCSSPSPISRSPSSTTSSHSNRNLNPQPKTRAKASR